MKNFDLKCQPSMPWTKLAMAGLLAAALAGCGGGSDGAPGAPGAPGTPGTPGATGPAGRDLSSQVTINANNTTPTAAAIAAWQAMQPQVTVNSVAISGTPVVKFTVKDAAGLPIVGLGNASQAATARVASLANISFTLAKLVPSANNEPSKWVSYGILRPATVAEAAGTIAATTSCNNTATVAATWCGTYPAADNQGTLVDNRDGSYQYTFYRDVTQVKSLAAGLNDTADGLSKKADLGDLTYDGTLTHRLGVIISGNMPGTGSNTPTAVASSVAAAPLVYNFNLGYDFVPNGGTPTVTRKVVDKASCSTCHDGKGIGHAGSAVNGFQVGRNDPNLCVTCHTDQIKYSFDAGNMTFAADGITIVSAASSASTQVKRAAQAILGGRAVGDYPNMIHKTHMGGDLVLQGYNFNNNGGAQQFNTVGFPQSPTNCTKCHTGTASTTGGNTIVTPNGDNWKNVPSMLACGACHDGINFATGGGITLADRDKDVAAGVAVGTTKTGHIGGAKADNATCVLCHAATDVATYHRSTVATPNNPVAKTGVSSFSYSISSVTVNGSGQPVVTFGITKDGAAVTSLAAATTVVNAANGQVVADPAFQPIAGFVGGPSIYIVAAVPQDGIAKPADTNVRLSVSLTGLLIPSGSPKAGSVTADGQGGFTATVTGDLTGQAVTATCKASTGSSAIGMCVNPSPIVLPANATMVTAALRGGFTQVNAPGYPYTAAKVTVSPNVAAIGGIGVGGIMVQKVATGQTARRLVVDTAKCNSCHDRLGTSPNFHGGSTTLPAVGASSNAQQCYFCHNPNQTSSGWSADASTFIHGIHGDSKRSVPFTWHAVDKDDNYSSLGYPGVLKDCNQCHLPNTVNYGANASVVPNMLSSANGVGKYNAATDTVGALSPYVVKDNVKNYGNGFSFVPAGSVVSAQTKADGTVVAQHIAAAGGEIVAADPATLVNSPIASACFACHDTNAAKAHMTTNGGAIYEARATALIKTEGCLVCHGAGKEFDAAVVHQ